MPLDASVWAIPTGPSARERLHRYAVILAEAARRRGLDPGEAEEAAARVVRAASDPEFMAGAARKRLPLRPTLYALLERAVREARRWASIDEGDGRQLLEVNGAADGEFDRGWVLGLLRGAADELDRQAPALGETLSLHYGQGCAVVEIAARTRRKAARELREARRRVRLLLRRSVEDTVGSVEEFDAEIAALLAPTAGQPGYFRLAREVLSDIRDEGRRVSVRGLRAAAAAAFLLVAVAGYSTHRAAARAKAEAEEAGAAHARRLDLERQAHEAELDLEREMAFVHHGEAPDLHNARLLEAAGRLKRVRPDSRVLAAALCRRLGAGQDPKLYAEGLRGAGGSPEGAALSWDYSVYRAIAEAVWGEPRGAAVAPAGAPRRIEADRALLAAEYERALDLYKELQPERRGDPTVWLGGAMAATGAGSPATALRFVDEVVRLFTLSDGASREGMGCAQALQAMAFEKLGRAGEARLLYERAAKLAPDNSYAQALASRPPEPAASAAPPPAAAPGQIVFRLPAIREKAAVEATFRIFRERLEAAGLLARGELRSDSEGERFTVILPAADPLDFQKAEWLATRRGLFRARALAPREINDRWKPPQKPEGHEWSPLNLSYPAASRAPGRQRLVLPGDLPLSPEHLKVAYNAAEGKVTWSCAEPSRLSTDTLLALCLDGEIVWYGKVDASRSGALSVGADAPQTLLPILWAHGPLPLELVRERP